MYRISKHPLLNTIYLYDIEDIRLHNNKFYVLGTNPDTRIEGLYVFAFVTLASLNLRGVYPCNSDPQHMSFVAQLAVLRCDRQTHVLDVSKEEALEVIGFYQQKNSSSFGASAIRGNRLFLASLFEIEELSIANPSRPRLIQSINQFGCDVNIDITDNGDLYCMGCQSLLMFNSK